MLRAVRTSAPRAPENALQDVERIGFVIDGEHTHAGQVAARSRIVHGGVARFRGGRLRVVVDGDEG